MPTSTVAESDLKECNFGSSGVLSTGDLDFCIRGTPLLVMKEVVREGRGCKSRTKCQNR